MGSINEAVKTVLTYKDVALISSMSFTYLESVKGKVGDDIINHAHTLVNRLNREMSAYPINDFTEEDGKALVDDMGVHLMEYMRDVINDTDEDGRIKLSPDDVNKLLEQVNAYLGNSGKEDEAQTMCKADAIAEMKFGKKMTHRFFDPNEYVTMNPSGTTVIMEDGAKISAYQFWADRNSDAWEIDWSYWK